MLVRNYITLLIPSTEFVSKRYYPLILQLILLLITTNMAFFIDKIARRTLILFGAAAMVLINASSAVANFLMVEYPNEPIFKWVFIFENVLTVTCFAIAIQPVTGILKSELYPQSVKGFCGSMGTISQGVSTVISYQLYNITSTRSLVYTMYIVFLTNALLLYLLMYFLLPESIATSLADLQMTFIESTPEKDNHSVEKNSQK